MPTAIRSGTAEPASPSPKKRRWWRKKRFWLKAFLGVLLVFVALLVWLDGPGWRWIGQQAGAHFLPKLGIEGSFELEGRLSGGVIRVRGVNLSGNEVVRVAALEDATLRYRLGRVIKGQVDSLSLTGLTVDVDLDKLPESEEQPTQEKTDLPALLGAIRERVVPAQIELRRVTATARKDGEVLVRLGPTDFTHARGSEDFVLHLGETVAAGYTLPAQSSTLTWQPDQIMLDHFSPLAETAVSDVVVRFGEHDAVDLAAVARLFDSRVNLVSDLHTARAEFSGAPLDLAQVLEKFEVDLPLAGRLSGLSAQVAGLEGGLDTMTGTVALELPEVRYEEWEATETTLHATLAEAGLEAGLEGIALGSPWEMAVAGPVSREDGFHPGALEGTAQIAKLEAVLDVVRQRFLKSDKPFPDTPLPTSTLVLNFDAKFDHDWKPSASARVKVDAGQAAPAIALQGSWDGENVATGNLSLAGVAADGSFAVEAQTYHGQAEITNFDPAILSPWLDPLGIELPPGIQGTLQWAGSGSIKEKQHRGELAVKQISMQREELEHPVLATAAVIYEWPESVHVDSLELRHDAQLIQAKAAMENRSLAVRELRWQSAGQPLLQGTAEIPLPEDLADWKALLRSTEPVAIHIKGEELPLSQLHPFLPDSVRFPETSRAQIQMDVTGSPSTPELVVKLHGEKLALLGRDQVPVTDFQLQALGHDQALQLNGVIQATSYPPTKINAVTKWEPTVWAEDPETVKNAPLDGSIALERLQLAMFSDLIPQARKLGGEINLHATVTGTVGAPKPRAVLTADNLLFTMQGDAVPPLSKGTLRVTATPEELKLETLRGEMAAGNFQATGSAKIDGTTVSDIQLRLVADALPVARNDSVIVRGSADVSVTGTLEQARVAGTLLIEDSVFYKDVELLPIGVPLSLTSRPSLPTADSAAPEEKLKALPEPFRHWTLDLGLRTRNPFLIRGNLGTGHVVVDAKVGGTIGAPRPTGEVRLLNVSAQLPFSTLQIPAGRIVLRPDAPFDPSLEIRGTSTIRPYEVEIYVYGTISNPQIQTNSNPPLPENEVFTLIATGTTTRGIEDPDAASTRAVQLFVEEVRRGRIRIMRGLRPVLSVLDKVDFQIGERDPYTDLRFNSASVPFHDHWIFTVGFSEEGRTRTKATYLLKFR